MEPTVSTETAPSTAELNSLLDRLLDEVEERNIPPSPPDTPPSSEIETPNVSETVPVAAQTAPSGGGNFPLGGLLANPALLTALPTLAENLGPLLGSLSGGTGTASTATRPHAIDRHTALLCAIKPYLSPQRQGAAETVIRLCRIWDALERSGISLNGLLGGIGGAGAIDASKTNGEVT